MGQVLGWLMVVHGSTRGIFAWFMEGRLPKLESMTPSLGLWSEVGGAQQRGGKSRSQPQPSAEPALLEKNCISEGAVGPCGGACIPRSIRHWLHMTALHAPPDNAFSPQARNGVFCLGSDPSWGSGSSKSLQKGQARQTGQVFLPLESCTILEACRELQKGSS